MLLGCGSSTDQGPPAGGSAATPAAAPSGTPSPSGPTAASTPAAPTSVAIPSLDLDEQLVDLGLTGEGTLEVPEDPARVGWFTQGGRPGGVGPTVVVGHVDSTDGPAVFARLPELGPGDEVVLGSADGTRTRYRVTEARDVPQSRFPTEQVFGGTPTDTLRLITCTGPYDREVGRYTENRIVTAVPF